MFSKPVAKTGLILVLPAAVTLAVAGCGSSGNATAGTSDTTTAPATTASAPATVTDTIVPPTTTTTATTGTSTGATPTATGPVACATSNLTVSLGGGNGAAGSIVYPLHFTNRGSAACTMSGFPGVSFVAPGTGKQVGQPATRSSGASSPTITLSPGAEATAMVQAGDYLNFASCNAVPVSGFRVYPPANTAAAYVALPAGQKACTTATAAQLQVQPVTAGTGNG